MFGEMKILPYICRRKVESAGKSIVRFVFFFVTLRRCSATSINDK